MDLNHVVDPSLGLACVRAHSSNLGHIWILVVSYMEPGLEAQHREPHKNQTDFQIQITRSQALTRKITLYTSYGEKV